MVGLTPLEIASRTKACVRDLGAAFGSEPSFDARASALGIGHWDFYFGGRAGVLGPTSAEVVTAACGFFAPDLVRESWTNALSAHSCSALVDADIELCVDWWSARLGEGVGFASELVRLTSSVLEDADTSGRPLFAAWKARAFAASSVVERLGLNLLSLRELRGANHLLVVAAAGVAPIDVVLAAGGDRKARANGFGNASMRGRRGPAGEGPDIRLDDIERETDRLTALSFAGITATERGRLADLIEDLKALVVSRAPAG